MTETMQRPKTEAEQEAFISDLVSKHPHLKWMFEIGKIVTDKQGYADAVRLGREICERDARMAVEENEAAKGAEP